MDLRADKKSLKKLLGMEDEQFRIPPYQRPYSWTSEQVDDLWDDLREHSASGHFLGSLVLATEDENRPVVIDGQQRLTTLMMLFSVVRDACADRGMPIQVSQLQKRLIADDLASGDDRFKFKTGTVNWPVFRDFVIRESSDPERKGPQHVAALPRELRSRNAAVLDNLARIRGHVTTHLESMSGEDQKVWLAGFTKDLMDRVEVVVIEVRELADAFLLFETLNDRGLQLSAADLLKSHLLGRIAHVATAEQVDEAALAWDAMLEDLGSGVDVSRFLRHYLLGYQQSVRKDDVFGHFKTLIARRDPLWVLDELRKVARWYGEFENPSRVSHPPARAVLTDLQTLRATTCYIALLPARRYLSEQDFVDFAKLAEVLTYRYSTVVGLGTNELERKYRDAAQLLIASEGGQLPRARQILTEAMPDSATFLAAFDKMRMGTQYLLRYTLRKLEEHVAPPLEKQLQPNALVHIEHIMPKTLTPWWRAALGTEGSDLHEEYLNRYGNLTLFYAGLNIPASNRSFDEKRSYYSESEVELTRRLASIDHWDVAAIEHRQRELGLLADEVWAVPPLADSGDGAQHPLARFRADLGGLWRAVEPFVSEADAAVVEQWADRLGSHLTSHARHGARAADLGSRLQALLDRWDTYTAEARSVLAAAVTYFLEPRDAVPDDLLGGLDDDECVIAAAETALRG